MADPGAYTKEELASLHSQIVSNLEWAWELSGGSEDQLLSTNDAGSHAVLLTSCHKKRMGFINRVCDEPVDNFVDKCAAPA